MEFICDSAVELKRCVWFPLRATDRRTTSSPPRAPSHTQWRISGEWCGSGNVTPLSCSLSSRRGSRWAVLADPPPLLPDVTDLFSNDRSSNINYPRADFLPLSQHGSVHVCAVSHSEPNYFFFYIWACKIFQTAVYASLITAGKQTLLFMWSLRTSVASTGQQRTRSRTETTRWSWRETLCATPSVYETWYSPMSR